MSIVVYTLDRLIMQDVGGSLGCCSRQPGLDGYVRASLIAELQSFKRTFKTGITEVNYATVHRCLMVIRQQWLHQ